MRSEIGTSSADKTRESRDRNVVGCGIVMSSLFLCALTGCGESPSQPGASAAGSTVPPEPGASAAGSTVPPAQVQSSSAPNVAASKASTNDLSVYTYEVINVFPHDRGAFTQGLVFLDGQFLESTGLYGQSSLRRVELKTGQVLQQFTVPGEYFAEGLALLDGKLFQLTWQNQKGFVYDVETFKVQKEFAYAGEGWGLTTDGKVLILSDGTERLRFLDPNTFQEKRVLSVLARGHGVTRLNELEYIKGEIYANVWGTQYVVRIDPASGIVVGVVDLTGLLSPEERDYTTDVLNGIAYDAKGDRLFVTGKRWPKLFEVRLKLKK